MDNRLIDHAGMATRARRGREKPEPPLQTLYLGQWLHALGKRPVDVVRGTGINEGYISELISGKKKNPSTKYSFLIATFLGLKVDDLYKPPPDREFIKRAKAMDPDLLARLRSDN